MYLNKQCQNKTLTALNTMNRRWPKLLTPTYLSQMIRSEKNPLTALSIFNDSKSKYPNYKHNGPVYAAMIDILATTNHLTEMKTVIQQMKQDSCECKDSTFATAIATYAKDGLLDEAVSLFKDLRNFNCVDWTESFNTLSRVLIKEGELETAHLIYLENSNNWEVRNRVGYLNMVIGTLCEKKRSDLALEVFQEMSDQCCFPDKETYKLLMKGLCEERRLNEATHLLYSMFWRISQKGSGEDITVYRTILDALCDNGEVDEAVNLLGKVLKKGLKTRKQRREGSLVSKFRESGSLEGLKGLINETLVRNGVPSLASYSAMAADLYEEGKIEDANKVIDEMRKKGFSPEVETYEMKIAALCIAGKVYEGVEVFEREMVEWNCVPRVGTYNIVLKGLCCSGNSMKSLGYLEKMGKQVGCVADKETYSILVDGLCCEGRFVEASKVFEKMMDRKFWPSNSAYSRLIGGLCNKGRRYDALLWLEEMISQGMTPDICLWKSLVDVVCSNMTCVDDCIDAVQLTDF